MTKLEAHCWSFLFILFKYHIMNSLRRQGLDGELIWSSSFQDRHELIKVQLEGVIEQ